MALVFLSIGSNLGDKELNITNSVEKIKNEVGNVLNISSFYYSEPVGFKSENNFVNIVLSLNTRLLPEPLLEKLQSIEKKMGRVKPQNVRYADRIIDIDIISYDDWIIKTPFLQIPHSEMEKRDFVLMPLAEISPDFIHPSKQKTIKELIRSLGKNKSIQSQKMI